mgnify:CR=1 FL=1
MPDNEIVGTPSETPAPAETPETPPVSLDSLVGVLTSDQLQSLIAAVPEDTLRQMARSQEHTLGKVVQSESNRQMESWRQNELRKQTSERELAQRAQRSRWLETAPDDEVASRMRDEAKLASVEENVRYQNYVAMFTEMRPFIDSLPEERRAKVTEFVQSPNAEREWHRLPTLIMREYNEHQDAQRNAKATSEREAIEARRTATAVAQPAPADVGRGATVSGGGTTQGDGRRDDVRTVAQRLSELGVKVPPHFLKAN